VALLGPCGAFTEPRRPLMFLLSLPGTPESESESARCAVQHQLDVAHASPVLSGVDLEVRGPCFALPVKARRAFVREHLLSYREPASRNPQVAREDTFKNPHARAPFRLLPIRAPRQWGYELLPWLAPSFSNRSCDLPEAKTRDASDRLLPPNRPACTRTSCVPGSRSPLSWRGHPAETKAP
jgi:hypothetical protein